MTKEKIEELALVAYPVIFDAGHDYNEAYRNVAIEFGLKLSFMMYSEEQMRESYLEGSRVTFNYTSENITPEEFDKSEDEYIESLKQK